MKSFLQHLTESQKTYEFRIKLADIDPDEHMDRLESALDAYGLDSISKPKRLPIKENDIDFPSKKNCQIYLIDVVLTYPVNDAQLRAIIGERCCFNPACVIVVPKNHPEEIWRWNIDGQSEIKEYKQGEAVLTQQLPEATAEQKLASQQYSVAGSILKELDVDKSTKVKIEIVGNDHTISGEKNPADGKTTNDTAISTKSPIKGQ